MAAVRVAPILLLAFTTSAFAADPPTVKKYALLVGCTEYQNPAIKELYGPSNDSGLWNKLLTEQFQFPKANVQHLVGWPQDVKARPSYANIVAAFESLIAKAGPDVQIFILLSGHGTQVPIPETQTNPLDPKNPEPDGMDEVFLPADAKGWSKDGLENAILDDQMGRWLDQMRERGASVWIVFDCCHSGSMTRSVEESERPRTVDAERDLGIPRKVIEETAQRAAAAVAKTGDGERGRSLGTEKGALKVQANKGGKGSLVAFYGAQSFEEAPELPRPFGAARVRENYYGMMSYTLIQTLQDRKSPLTYRELTQAMLSQYRSERSSRPPTPLAEGDLDREVLGARVWPNRSDIVLEREKTKYRVTAGQLRGITPGSVIAISPPAGDARDAKLVLGHVRVVSANAVSATVEPCNAEGKPGGKADLPNLARCEVVLKDLGDLRVRVAVSPATLAATVEKLDPRVAALVRIVPELEAEWILRHDTPAGEHVLLLQADGRKVSAEEKKQAAERQRSKRDIRAIYGKYPGKDAKALAGDLERDLQKIFKWQNVWRIAASAGGQGSGPDYGLKFEVRRLKNSDDTGPGEPLTNAVLTPGTTILPVVENGGTQNLWVSILYCGADYSITSYTDAPFPLTPGQKLRLKSADVSDDSTGTEGFVVFAIPQTVSPEAPRFDFLLQDPLGILDENEKGRGPGDAPATPFGQLLAGAAFGRGTRALKSNTPTNPAVKSMSWVTVKPVAKQ